MQNAGAFADPVIPPRFAPFNVRGISDRGLLVTYAQKDPNSNNDVPGIGNGFIAAFDYNGNLLITSVARGPVHLALEFDDCRFNIWRIRQYLVGGELRRRANQCVRHHDGRLEGSARGHAGKSDRHSRTARALFWRRRTDRGQVYVVLHGWHRGRMQAKRRSKSFRPARFGSLLPLAPRRISDISFTRLELIAEPLSRKRDRRMISRRRAKAIQNFTGKRKQELLTLKASGLRNHSSRKRPARD